MSKLDSLSQQPAITDSNKEQERFNPLEHNANIQQELWIQKQFNCFIPGILFQVNSESFPGWDLDDLEMFFKEIGEIQLIQTSQNKTAIIYYRFYDALVAIEFFRNPQNFKEEINKDTFSINWIELNSELSKSFSEEVNSKVFYIYEGVHSFYKDYFIKSSNGFNGMPTFSSPMQSMQSMQQQQMNYMGNQGNQYWQGYNQNMQSQNMNYSGNYKDYKEGSGYSKGGYKNGYDEEAKSGKYTCRFEILLDNDKEFQIARKLIGAKGCNMKRIVETCGSTNDGNEVKLRLRGRGSGYKEGPFNRESDDPLHLCISSKSYDKYQHACQLVQELINSVFEEYKKYCYKYNKTPLQKIYNKKEEGISRKSTHGTGYNNYENVS
mmetsp:Transcript_11524/g.11849  ORF Transcript_11524/g.11849 Transcript_11524/m.11849 type:complete len:379 (-) Transcript_11524:158-1294(-)|eukprot:CAMPEP_0170515342 /NCGR_PEP_ID=MMETSP0209-20121228/1772_1 /TAXON_ID=665100 ORGANISM="Litonotus pictus, Strain P1" /NCGR_SAMPLE_ID=MMETSP0209 /ASSEMBLY_ACC=CAM_ASM_000301 /LENGTH=378 /DNA_ID=CAMNT_0010799775 /DNA_START=9 /DNA_END=1145 /DNA_ORIENTATION=-